MQTILLRLKISFININFYIQEFLFCSDSPIHILPARHFNEYLPFTFVLLQTFLIRCYQWVIMSEI